MQLPFDLEKTLNFIVYLLKDRNCSLKTIHCYLSAVRMAHLTQGIDCPHLRKPIVVMGWYFKYFQMGPLSGHTSIQFPVRTGY